MRQRAPSGPRRPARPRPRASTAPSPRRARSPTPEESDALALPPPPPPPPRRPRPHDPATVLSIVAGAIDPPALSAEITALRHDLNGRVIVHASATPCDIDLLYWPTGVRQHVRLEKVAHAGAPPQERLQTLRQPRIIWPPPAAAHVWAVVIAAARLAVTTRPGCDRHVECARPDAPRIARARLASATERRGPGETARSAEGPSPRTLSHDAKWSVSQSLVGMPVASARSDWG